MKKTTILILSMLTLHVQAIETKPYAGQQERMIKALSTSEIDGLKKGKGMGLAKAAELNHYPGPRHVLDEANKLSLSDNQLSKTNNLFDEMKKEAVMVGEKIISAERELDNLFVSGEISKAQLKEKLNEIGQYRAQLRFVHLKTHLKQKKILSSRQVKHYDMLRGYSGDMSKHQNHRSHH